MKGYKHLTEFDRNKIARMRKEGATMREIGAACTSAPPPSAARSNAGHTPT